MSAKLVRMRIEPMPAPTRDVGTEVAAIFERRTALDHSVDTALCYLDFCFQSVSLIRELFLLAYPELIKAYDVLFFVFGFDTEALFS